MNNITRDCILTIDGNNININNKKFIVNDNGNIQSSGSIISKNPYLFLQTINTLNILNNNIYTIIYDSVEYDDSYMDIPLININDEITESNLNFSSTIINYNTISGIIQSNLNISINNDGSINLPLDGLYSIEAQVTFTINNYNNKGDVILYIYKNNDNIVYSRMWKQFNNSDTNTININATIRFKSNDKLSIKVSQATADSIITGCLFNPCWCILRYVG